MKKALLFALAALCVSAAQAVTFNWTVNTPTYNANSGNQWVGVAILAGDLTNYDFTNNPFSLAYSTTDKTVTSTHADFLGGSLQEVAAATAQAKTSISNSITFDGTDVKDFTILFFAPYQYTNSQKNGNAYAFHVFRDGTFDMSEGAVIDFTFGSIDLTQTGSTTAVVPEPTVLALLALGVAGLALKRKVA